MKKKIITIVLVLILLILFVPIKVKYRDGGTIDYRAIAYRVINWNKLKEDWTYYKAKDIIFFPNNFHSIEYYEPIEVPSTYVSVNTQQNNEASSQNDEETIELPNAYVTSNNTEKMIPRTEVFVVEGNLIDNLLRKVNFDDPASLDYFQRMLREKGVIDALRQKGAKDGCVIRIEDMEFDFVD